MSLCHLTYRSRSAIPSADGSPFGALGVLLEQCLDRNPPRRITGILAFCDGRFLQVIEGPVSAVDPLFAAIRRDPRHGQVEVLLREPCDARRFASWSMAFAYRDPRLPGVFGRLSAGHPSREAVLSAVHLLASIVA